ncbi:putative damage-inducible protein DinB [Bradyrhizobium sp. USDA 372]
MFDSFRTLARWTGWANQRIYSACSELDPTEYFRPRACAFGSIHRTLNHLLATDRIWLARLTGEPHNIPSLDYEVCVDFSSLRDARFVEDVRIVETTDLILDKDGCAGNLSFNSMDGTPRQMPIHLVLSQLFLHHAHHRGQVHALLSQTAVTPPALDLTYFPGAAGQSALLG